MAAARNARASARIAVHVLGEKDHAMAKDLPINGREPDRSEDDIQRDQLGPRGIPGAKDPATMTPQRDKKMPDDADPGHPA
ncbi:hypothetical protein [Bradyrhizobium sp.]|uniref:hypothetical protein n=2 Tax=Bradyrhizobium TaxID=374 RepID=UPI00269F881C